MPWWYGLIGHGGFYGVELFFVLSGFLIGRILLRSEQQLAQPVGIAVFYIRRWFRTLPLFWLFIAINVLLEFFLRNRRLTLTEILGHGFFLQNFAALKMSFFGKSWSLAVEEWFYLLFPLALWLGLKIWKRFDTVFLLTAAAFFLFSTVARMFSAPHPNASWTDWQRMVVIYRFDALMIGVFAAWLSLRFSNALAGASRHQCARRTRPPPRHVCDIVEIFRSPTHAGRRFLFRAHIPLHLRFRRVRVAPADRVQLEIES